MRKLLFGGIFLTLPSVVFAFGISFGLGGSISAYHWDYTTFYGPDSYGDSLKYDTSVSETLWSGKVFVDATYLDLEAGYMIIKGDHFADTTTTEVNYQYSPSSSSADYPLFSQTFATFGGFLKIPFTVGGITFFPIAGVQYNLNLTCIAYDGSNYRASATSQELSDLNELWIKAGIGADLSLSKRFFLRPEGIVGFKLLDQEENNLVSSDISAGASSSNITGLTYNFSLLFGFRV